ncbi:MAG: hypothetical protein ACTSYR_05365 [Candidatus Odinarchaeia archaeon]
MRELEKNKEIDRPYQDEKRLADLPLESKISGRTEKELFEILDESSRSKLVKLESELYANITTLDSIIRNFQEGRIDPASFKRLYKSLMRDVFKTKIELEKLGLDVSDFLKKYNLNEEYKLAVKKLKLESEDDSLIYEIMFESPGKIATLTFNLASEFASISDLVKLKFNATYELTSFFLKELKTSFIKYPGFGRNHKITKEIEEWINKLKNGNPESIIRDNMLKELEDKIREWKQEFYLKLKEISV